MAGLLSSLFGSDSSTESHNAHVPASTLDDHQDGGGQGAQSFDETGANRGDDGSGEPTTSAPIGHPTYTEPTPQSGDADAHGF